MDKWSDKKFADKFIGREVSSVVFIHDYLQILFHEYTLSVYEFPIVKDGEKVFSYGEINYENNLVSLIGKKVKKAKITDDKKLEIQFNRNLRLIINLNVKNLVESLYFSFGADWGSF